jgi:phosphosulfolactate synthase (CoM biosynthesis protein A)
MLADVLDLAGQHVDCVKFARGCFTVMPEAAVRSITELCHKHQVGQGGGWNEGPAATPV